MKQKNKNENAGNGRQPEISDEQIVALASVNPQIDLGDEQRIKVMSPGMLVAKRFLRNKLAIIGTVIITFMFLFSFLGGLLTPYDETVVFKHMGLLSKEYVNATQSNEFKFHTAAGMTYDSSAHARFILEKNKGNESFEAKGITYGIIKVNDNLYRITQAVKIASVLNLRGVVTVTPEKDAEISAALEAAASAAILDARYAFEFEGAKYALLKANKEYTLARFTDAAIESMMIIEPVSSDIVIDFETRYQAELAMGDEEMTSIIADGKEYTIERKDHFSVLSLVGAKGSTPYAVISDFSINPAADGVIISMEFREALHQAIADESPSFKVEGDTLGTEYTVKKLNNVYTVKTQTRTELITMNESPSGSHWLGTDTHGMDVMTRLMYGGRISLVIGFIVVALETILGVILGGLSGYFGKWVDMLIMRVVDVFNCIPFLPLLIILGSVMDKMDVDPQKRIYYLMLLLGLISWPGIARVVRGQILSLREQEFMIAAEATGITVSKKIFKHLVPNVIPQLIVFATLGLGGIILTESALSFLGLGVKFPFASWGNIISGVTTAYEMTHFWFAWIPAGILILLTVLGFNFVGDGLRDAYDPKMKR
ncbi:MAG: ABC transporter permease [Saccharofermentanales bacterium]